MKETTHTGEFNVEGTPAVRIGNIRGSVTVKPGQDGVVSITAVERGSDGRTQVEIGQEPDGTVYARTRYDRVGITFGLLGEKPNRVEYTVTVPAQTDLAVKCVAADTDVRGLSGSLRLKSVSGDVNAADLSGDLHLETVSGRIQADRLSGPAVLRSVSGRIGLTGSDLPTLDANTVSGSMELETPIGEGPYEIKSVSGNVRIRTGERPAGRIHFKSISGSASVDSRRLRSSKTSSRPGPKQELYVLSEEGPDIHFKSVSGSLKMYSEGFDPDAEQDVLVEPAPAKPGRMEILERIASGEMSVDDAVKEMGGG